MAGRTRGLRLRRAVHPSNSCSADCAFVGHLVHEGKALIWPPGETPLSQPSLIVCLSAASYDAFVPLPITSRRIKGAPAGSDEAALLRWWWQEHYEQNNETT